MVDKTVAVSNPTFQTSGTPRPSFGRKAQKGRSELDMKKPTSRADLPGKREACFVGVGLIR